jgi:hypothetical protein
MVSADLADAEGTRADDLLDHEDGRALRGVLARRLWRRRCPTPVRRGRCLRRGYCSGHNRGQRIVVSPDRAFGRQSCRRAERG